MSEAVPSERSDASFLRGTLAVDVEAETHRIVEHLRESVVKRFSRQGAVVGVSGGIDSSVALALSVRAFGPERVVALILQEKESSPENPALARELCRAYGTMPVAEDITAALEGFGCYRRRDEAIREVIPEYDSTYRCKITLPANLLDSDAVGLFSVTVISPEGQQQTKRLPLRQYLRVVAATNFKQRTRMAMLYNCAEGHNYAVIGTANKNERDQGFFVKYGDGGADVDAIAHLYKTQVYQLGAYLGVPESIRRRTPTTDTYSAPTTEEEFFFRLPFETMDRLWYAEEHRLPVEEVAQAMQLTPQQVARAYREFAQRRRSTDYLRSQVVALPPEDSGPR